MFNRAWTELCELKGEHRELDGSVKTMQRNPGVLHMPEVGGPNRNCTEISSADGTMAEKRERKASVERRIAVLESIFEDPVVEVDGEIELRPELRRLGISIKDALLKGMHKDSNKAHPTPASNNAVPAYCAPDAEWSTIQSGTQQARPPSPFNRVETKVKNYFKSFSAAQSSIPATQYAVHGGRRAKISQPMHPHPLRNKKLKYIDFDAPGVVPAFTGPLLGELYGPGGEAKGSPEHQRLYTHPEYCRRTVKVDRIKPSISLIELVQKMPSGYFILDIKRSASSRVSGTDMVFFTFLCTEDAFEFADLAVISPLLNDYELTCDAIVTHLDMYTVPFPRHVHDAIYNPNIKATRVLMLDCLPRALFNAHQLRRLLIEVFPRSLEALLCDPEFIGCNGICLTFCRVEDALLAYNKWTKITDSMWSGVKIYFQRDNSELPDLRITDDPSERGEVYDDSEDGPDGTFPPPASDDYWPSDDEEDDVDQRPYHCGDGPTDEGGPEGDMGGNAGVNRDPAKGDESDRDDERRAEGGTGPVPAGSAGFSSPNPFKFSPRPMIAGCGELTRNEAHAVRVIAANAARPAVRETTKANRVEVAQSTAGPSVKFEDKAAPTAGKTDTMPLGLGIKMPCAGEVDKYMSRKRSPCSSPASPEKGASSASSKSPPLQICGNIAVRGGYADAIAIARAMGQSRWAN